VSPDRVVREELEFLARHGKNFREKPALLKIKRLSVFRHIRLPYRRSGGNYHTFLDRDYSVASMLLWITPRDKTHSNYLLSDADHSAVRRPRYMGELSTAYNYTLPDVAFREAVGREF